MRVLIYFAIIILIATFGKNVTAAGVCSDEGGVCASSPFCLGKKVGSSCRKVRTCQSLGNKQLQPCCSCSRGKVRRGIVIIPGLDLAPSLGSEFGGNTGGIIMSPDDLREYNSPRRYRLDE